MALDTLIRTLFVNKTDTLSASQILLALGVALVFATGIGLAYILTQKPTREGRLFALGLVLAAGLMGIATAIISKNLPLALAHVGALTIVRFRSPISSPVDNVFIFWAVVVGMASGAGAYLLAALAVALGALFLAYSPYSSADQRDVGSWLLIQTKGPSRVVQAGVERAMRRYLRSAHLARCDVEGQTKACSLYYRVRGDAAGPRLRAALAAVQDVSNVAWGEAPRA